MSMQSMVNRLCVLGNMQSRKLPSVKMITRILLKPHHWKWTVISHATMHSPTWCQRNCWHGNNSTYSEKQERRKSRRRRKNRNDLTMTRKIREERSRKEKAEPEKTSHKAPLYIKTNMVFTLHSYVEYVQHLSMYRGNAQSNNRRYANPSTLRPCWLKTIVWDKTP